MCVSYPVSEFQKAKLIGAARSSVLMDNDRAAPTTPQIRVVRCKAKTKFQALSGETKGRIRVHRAVAEMLAA